MKLFNKIFLLFVVITMLSMGCGREFLNRTPFAQYTSENFWENEVQITNSVNGIYPLIRGQYSSTVWRFGEFRSDNTTFLYNPADRGGLALEELDYFLANSSLGDLGGMWRTCYTGIARANFVLASIDDAAFTNEENRPIREAETRFLRAFFYYLLVTNYGDVPIVLEPLLDEAEAIAKRRDPINTVFSAAIIPDLEFAIATLPESFPLNEKGRATKGAAQMLLAKAYFFQNNYEEAKPLLDSLVASGNYLLEQNYRDVFSPDNKATPEVIFAAEFATAANQGSGFMVSWLPYNSDSDITLGIQPGSRGGLNSPTADMIRAYEAGDKRFDASIGFYVKNNDTFPYVNKFLFPPIEAGGSNVNFPIFRYADVLLMQAEALLEIQGGLPDAVFETINLLRTRAGLPLIYPGNPDPELNVDTQEKLVAFLRKERRIELAFESHRWYDLMRYGNVVEVMRAHGEEQKQLQSFLVDFPDAYMNIPLYVGLPAGQVLQYGYTQNPGW